MEVVTLMVVQRRLQTVLHGGTPDGGSKTSSDCGVLIFAELQQGRALSDGVVSEIDTGAQYGRSLLFFFRHFKDFSDNGHIIDNKMLNKARASAC